MKPHEINVKRRVLCSWPWVSSSIPGDVTAQACESTQAAEHSLRAVCTDNCHLSFPWVSVGGQGQGHLHQNTAPHGFTSGLSARATCPRNTLKPEYLLLCSPAPCPFSCHCQYHPLPSPALDTPPRVNLCLKKTL